MRASIGTYRHPRTRQGGMRGKLGNFDSYLFKGEYTTFRWAISKQMELVGRDKNLRHHIRRVGRSDSRPRTIERADKASSITATFSDESGAPKLHSACSATFHCSNDSSSSSAPNRTAASILICRSCISLARAPYGNLSRIGHEKDGVSSQAYDRSPKRSSGFDKCLA